MWGRQLTEIVGWVIDGAAYCPDHGPTTAQEADEDSGWSPIFLDGSATDCPDHCGEPDCGRLLRTDLTDDGYRYVLATLDDQLRDPDRTDHSVLAEWWDEWGGEIVDAVRRGPLDDLDPFDHRWLTGMVRGYAACALWSELDDDGEPLDGLYRPEDITGDGVAEMTADCVDFAAGNVADLHGMDPEQAGHDFWLTRNGHGAGFWDRGLGDRGERLSKAATVYGESCLYVGDDGDLHVT